MKTTNLAVIALTLARGAARAQYFAYPYRQNGTILMPPSGGQTRGFSSNGAAPQPTFLIPNARREPAPSFNPNPNQPNWQQFCPGHRC
jgi:hypothetical protein